MVGWSPPCRTVTEPIRDCHSVRQFDFTFRYRTSHRQDSSHSQFEKRNRVGSFHFPLNARAKAHPTISLSVTATTIG